MVDGRNRQLWAHTSAIMAAALSAFRKKMVDPAKLNPYRQGGGGQGIRINPENIGLLKALVPKRS